MANTIKLKPVQSVGATEIEYEYDQLSEHAISVTYSELKDLRDNKKLIPGIFYRITDFVTTTAQENTISAGYPYDIIVRAVTESSLDENARAALHEGDTHFAKARIDSWVLRYSLDNDQTRFGWADPVNGKGVVYYLKDAWDNECCFDFKNIQYLGSSLYKFTEGLGDILDDTAYYFTFHKVGYGDYSDCNGPDFQDDATNCAANVIDVYIDDEPYSRWLPKIVLICQENTYNDIIFNKLKGPNVRDIVVYGRFQYNDLEKTVKNVFINSNASYNKFYNYVNDICIKAPATELNYFENDVQSITITSSSNVFNNSMKSNCGFITLECGKDIAFNVFDSQCGKITLKAPNKNIANNYFHNFVSNLTVEASSSFVYNVFNDCNKITITTGSFQQNKLMNCTNITITSGAFVFNDLTTFTYASFNQPNVYFISFKTQGFQGSSKGSISLDGVTFPNSNNLIKELCIDGDSKYVIHWKSSLLTETGYYKDSATDTTWKAIA